MEEDSEQAEPSVEELNDEYRCIMCGQVNLSYTYAQSPPYHCQCGHETWIHPVLSTHTDALETLSEHCQDIRQGDHNA